MQGFEEQVGGRGAWFRRDERHDAYTPLMFLEGEDVSKEGTFVGLLWTTGVAMLKASSVFATLNRVI